MSQYKSQLWHKKINILYYDLSFLTCHSFFIAYIFIFVS